jgi:glycosyltransferase involved in cell wall biosynthesis
MRTYGVNGGERQLGQLFRSSDAGTANTFITIYRDEACDAFMRGIERLALKRLSNRVAPNFPSLRREMSSLLQRLPVLQIRLLLALRRGRYDVCVAHGVQAALVCWLAASLPGATKFVYVHRGAKSREGSHPLFKLVYRPFNAIAGVSKASAASLLPLASGRRVLALENGIDWRGLKTRAGPLPEKEPQRLQLICVGRLMPDKGQQIILEAFAQLIARHSEARLVVVGEGPDHEGLLALTDRLGLTGQVKFVGHVADVPARLAASDIFLHASKSEGMSNAVLEAMALGLASVVGEAPGVSECHIEGETGFVVDRTPEDFARRLITLAEDPGLRRRMGEAARKRVRALYSIEANRARYLDLYTQLLETG